MEIWENQWIGGGLVLAGIISLNWRRNGEQSKENIYQER
jgi:drug/metabolite transporter (DMT)-like permease